MSLAFILRVAAGWMGLWAVGMFLAPQMVLEGTGWEMTAGIETLMQGMGMAFIGLIVVHLVAATLVEDAMQKLAFWIAIVWVANHIQQAYFMANGIFPADGRGIFGLVVGFVIAGMLYTKSKSKA
ncbi:MAG: hypothetical protein GY881_12955 [Gammaproteobacteria bacterium]|nr:hypothetical protein [Gammaproteobacteria bacterium]MCP4881166.1 hypothetical protein [Gammaproteobacteria bacterium]MDP6166363.1 hypothetical protein [Gammaproteobacteria bacterium]